jgi:hypothetical protein
MEEKVYFDKKGVLVTDKRVVVKNTTSPIVNIRSVTMIKHRHLGGLLLMIMAGITTCLWSVALLIDSSEAYAYVGLVILLGIIGLGFMVWDKKASYSVRLSGELGSTDILKAGDKEFILEVIDAINKAIVVRL